MSADYACEGDKVETDYYHKGEKCGSDLLW